MMGVLALVLMGSVLVRTNFVVNFVPTILCYKDPQSSSSWEGPRLDWGKTCLEGGLN